MNHLIVYAHPNEDSLNHKILQTAVDALKAGGHEVVVRDLYKMGFNPVLSLEDTKALKQGNLPEDIRTEQNHLTGADVITLIYPIWWAGLPAILKGYIDRVFAYKFAYTYNGEGMVDKLLTGKKGVIISTYGTSEDYYEAIGMEEALKQTSGEGIFNFCGVEIAEQLLFGGVNKSVTDQERREMLERVRSLFSAF